MRSSVWCSRKEGSLSDEEAVEILKTKAPRFGILIAIHFDPHALVAWLNTLIKSGGRFENIIRKHYKGTPIELHNMQPMDRMSRKPKKFFSHLFSTFRPDSCPGDQKKPSFALSTRRS